MWVLLAFLGLWLFYSKSYYTFRFNALEKIDKEKSDSTFPYKLNRVSPKDFGFILSRASTVESTKSKVLANLLGILFYIDLFILIFLKDIVALITP